MAYFTVPQIIEIAEVSEYLATKDTLKGQLYSPLINPKIAKVIALELAAVRWAYNQTPTYTDIQYTANYLYDLCYKSFQARNIINGGGGGVPIVPVTPSGHDDCSGLFVVTASMFEVDGKTYFNADWAGKNITIFWYNIPNYIFQPDWLPALGGGFTIVNPSDFDANTVNADAIFVVTVGCVTPGAVINPYQTPINTTIDVAAGVDIYDLTWTTGLSGAYGDGDFYVEQTSDGVNWNPSGIQPTYLETDSPRVYHFTGLGSLQSRIIIS